MTRRAGSTRAALQRWPDTADELLVYTECRQAQIEGREISDGCARTIAAMYYDTRDGVSFVTTGAIPESPSILWRELVGSMYDNMDANDRLMADMLGTYLINAGERGPVPEWSKVWVR